MPSPKKKIRRFAAGSKKAAAELVVEKARSDTPATGRVDPHLRSRWMQSLWQKRPPFSLTWADLMRFDHQVKFGMCIRNGPAYGLKVEVDSPRPAVKEFVTKQWDRIWSQEAEKLLRDQHYGYLAYEAMYRYADGQFQFDRYIDRHPMDTKPLTLRQKLVGVNFHERGTKALYGPQALWLTYDAEAGSLFGTSILESPFAPWYEKTMESGANAIRKLRMVKDAWIGDQIYYDIDFVFPSTTPGGQEYTAQQVAVELMENRHSGAAMALPARLDPATGKLIEILRYVPPTGVQGLAPIMEWVEACDWDILDGLEIPREVVEASETGSGYSGRAVPNEKFLAGLNPKLGNRIRQIKEQTLVPLVAANHGADAADEFDIKLVPLEKAMAEAAGPRNPPPAPGQGQPQGNGFMSNRLQLNGRGPQQFSADFEEKHPRDTKGRFIEVRGDEFGKTDAELLANAKAFFKTNLQGKQFVNAHSGRRIIVGGKSLKKAINHLPDKGPLKALAKLPELLEDAVYESSRLPEGNEQNVHMYHYFVADLQFEGIQSVSRLKIREDNNGNWFYDQHIQEKAKGPPLSQSAPPKGQTGLAGGPFSKSIDDVPRFVKNSPPPAQFSSEPSRWITIGGRTEGDKKHVGGFPVQISDDGTILKSGGLQSLVGKKLSGLKKHFAGLKKKREKETTSFDPSEWEPKARKVNRESRSGGAIAEAAAKHDVDESELAEAVDWLWKEKRDAIEEREAAKKDAREITGLTADRINKWEDAGKDSGSWPSLDATSRTVAGAHPELGIGHGFEAGANYDATDYAGQLWQILKEGKRSPPAKHDPKLIDEAAGLVLSGRMDDDELEELEQLRAVAFSTDDSREAFHNRIRGRLGQLLDRTTQFSVQHAPEGGITIAGKRFEGGEFIPGEAMAKASKKERATLESNNIKGHLASYRPPSPDDLKSASIFLWHGTSADGMAGILKKGSVSMGSRGLNAAAHTASASQYPEDTGAEALVLLSAETAELGIDPNDQTGKTVEEGLFGGPDYSSACTVGKHRIVAVFDLTECRNPDKAIELLQRGKFDAATKLGVGVSVPHESVKAD